MQFVWICGRRENQQQQQNKNGKTTDGNRFQPDDERKNPDTNNIVLILALSIHLYK